jgi:hypothetical protein
VSKTVALPFAPLPKKSLDTSTHETYHLPMPRFSKAELEQAVASSFSFGETLRKLKLCTTGGNHQTIKKYCQAWEISTAHFLTQSERIKLHPPSQRAISLDLVLIENSTYSRTRLKKRLYEERLKKPVCELCGQDEWWCGKKMSLILDHKNGIRDDCRLNNLRIVCPNCEATLPTHCGKRSTVLCPACQKPVSAGKKYCSHPCYTSFNNNRPHPEKRKIKRPPYDKLLKEIEEMGFSATGRKYGVSDNAIRKWLKTYEQYPNFK